MKPVYGENTSGDGLGRLSHLFVDDLAHGQEKQVGAGDGVDLTGMLGVRGVGHRGVGDMGQCGRVCGDSCCEYDPMGITDLKGDDYGANSAG